YGDLRLLIDRGDGEVSHPQAALRFVETIDHGLHRAALMAGPLFPVVEDDSAGGDALAPAGAEEHEAEARRAKRAEGGAPGEVADGGHEVGTARSHGASKAESLSLLRNRSWHEDRLPRAAYRSLQSHTRVAPKERVGTTHHFDFRFAIAAAFS